MLGVALEFVRQGGSFIYIDNSNGDSVPTIWVLGSANTNADKSIEWADKLPNFTDPDIVIVNLHIYDEDNHFILLFLI
jgi:hypothetical protein